MEQNFEHLGIKALWIFILQTSLPAFLFLLLSIFFPVIINYLPSSMPDTTERVIKTVGHGLMFLFLLSLFASLLVGYLRYITYKFSIGEDAVHIEKGILNKEAVAIPYRSIQDVNLKRSLISRLLGISWLIISSAGHEENFNNEEESGESNLILPALDKQRAVKLQQELLKRTNIEKVIAINQTPK